MNYIWNLKKFNNSIALENDEGVSVTYSELSQISDEIGKIINTRCILLQLCTNSIGSIAGYISFINQNIVPILINSNTSDSEVRKIISVYRPLYIWLPENMVIDYVEFEEVYRLFGYVLLYLNEKCLFNLFGELALLLTTSGSTGSRKLVRQSYNNIISNTLSIIDYLGLNSNERPITTLPMNYTYGLSIINTHIAVGATIPVLGFFTFHCAYNVTSSPLGPNKSTNVALFL